MIEPGQKRDIEALLNKAAYELDEHNLSEMECCFSEDVKVVIRIKSSGVEEPLDGREALMELVRDRVGTQTDRRRHLISNLMLASDGPDRVRATSYLTIISIENDSARLLTTGCYRDEVEFRGDQWLIVSRLIDLDLPY